eukprot:m.48094 g.48094  ORF g.48094 m.48094 type:complete len:392 (-) comp8897_c1_seq2:852-2027(-)
MPPPPPGPPPPPAPPPPAGASAAGSGKQLKLKSKGGEMKFDDYIKEKVDEAPDHIPSRPKTPPPKVPDVLREVSVVWGTTTELYNQVQFGSQLIVVDVRGEEDFKAGHVRSAINIPMSLIAGRSLVDIEDELPPRFKQRRTDMVFVYDEDSEEGAGVAAQFLSAMSADQRAAKPVTAVKGGFQAFASRFPFLNTGSEEFKSVEYSLEYPSMILDDFLFLGNWASASSAKVIDHLKITHVVNATAVCGMPFQDKIKYIQCALDDAPGADIKQFFSDTLSFMNDAESSGGRVLIHCQMGMSRSSTLVILWLMERHGMNLREATSYTRERRPFINPNPGFLLQLGAHELETRGKTTIRFPDEPVTLRTIYEWLADDGTWIPRVVVGYEQPSAAT